MFSELTKALRKMNGGKSRTMAAYLGEAEDEFDESKHPRGNPKNAGQFAKKGDSATGKSQRDSKTVVSKGRNSKSEDWHSRNYELRLAQGWTTKPDGVSDAELNALSAIVPERHHSGSESHGRDVILENMYPPNYAESSPVKFVKQFNGDSQARQAEMKRIADEWAAGADARFDAHRTSRIAEGEKMLNDLADKFGVARWDDMITEDKRESIVTPEQDATYMDAVKRLDFDVAREMVRKEAAKVLIPKDKVIGKALYTINKAAKFLRDAYISLKYPSPPYKYNDFQDVADDYKRIFGGTLRGNMLDVKARLYRAKEKVLRYYADIKGLKPKEFHTFKQHDKLWGDRNSIPYALYEIGGHTFHIDAEKMGIPPKEAGHNVIHLDNHIISSEVNKNDIMQIDDAINILSQIPSTDPVTYDDNHEVLPLSKRFAAANPNSRNSFDQKRGAME